MILIHATLAFFALSMTILSMWVKRSPWIWGSFLILAFALGYMAKLVAPIALVPVGGLIIVQTILRGDIWGLVRFILFVISVAISVGLMICFFPGFTEWPILKDVMISEGASPFSLYLNFSKPFMGIAVMAVGFRLISNTHEFGRSIKQALPLMIGGILILLTFALFYGVVKFDPKLPRIFWFFLVQNLIFVCVIEEAFWRGFVQRECFRAFGKKGLAANVGCILVTALFFAVLNWFSVSSMPFLALVFIAGIIYGAVYQYTKAIEASIVTHWLFNVTHFALFTYPALQTAM